MHAKREATLNEVGLYAIDNFLPFNVIFGMCLTVQLKHQIEKLQNANSVYK